MKFRLSMRKNTNIYTNMKYIITEGRMNNMIKEYILKNYDVVDVEFGIKRVHLGSGPNKKGETSIDQTTIEIYINNIKNTKTFIDLRNIKISIMFTLEQLFGIDFRTYGSEWNLTFYEVTRKFL